MAKALAGSDIAWISTYLRKFNNKGTTESKGNHNCFQLMANWWSPPGSIKYLYSDSKSLQSENEFSCIIFHTGKHMHIYSVQKAFAACLVYHTHKCEANFSSCCFCRECLFLASGGFSSFIVVRKQLDTEAVALRVVGSSGKQVTLHIGSCIFKSSHFL